MSPAVVLLALRLLAALGLYAFLVMIFIALARDSRLLGGRLADVPTAVLRLEGDASGTCFPLAELNSLGRAADNDVHLPFERVSAHHARLGYRGGQWWVEDLGSTNGTRVNEVRVDQALVVTYGDRIHVGDICLVLDRGGPGARSAAST